MIKRDRAIGERIGSDGRGPSRWARRFKGGPIEHHQEQSSQSRPFVVHVVGDIAPGGEVIGLQIDRSEQGPIDLCIRLRCEIPRWLSPLT